MKRFYIYLMVMATLLIGGGKAMAQSVTIDGVVYSVSGDYAVVSGNSGVGDTVVVHGTVTINEVEYPVTTVGAGAFSSCSNIVSVTLPDGISSIGNNAFESCSNLASINIGKGVVSIGDFTFRYCKKLNNIVLPDGLKSIGSYTFSTCESFTDIKVPAGVTVFGGCVFEYCYSLVSISLPKGLTVLPGHTFWECNSLASIAIPEGITTIELETFYSCENLSRVVLPNSLTNIDSKAFYQCSSLKKVVNNSSLPLVIGSTNYGYVAYYAQEIMRGDTCINNCWFYTDDNGEHHLIHYEGTDSAVVLPADYLGTNYSISGSVFSGHDEIVSVQIPEAVTSIGASAFSNCTNMKSITIPNSVVSIGENAFSGCTGLPIENGIRYADCYAIEVTDKTLTEYSLKNNVRFLGNALFQDCSAMTSVNIPSGVTSIGANTFNGCSSLTSVVLLDSITSIGASAFANCSSLTSVNIPSGVPSIEDNTFHGCSALTSLTLPESVTSIGSSAFYNCSLLTSVNIPSGVPSIEGNTFYDCSALTSLILPETVISIGPSAFNGCSSLSSMIIPASVTSVGNYAFNGCIGIKELTIADANTTLSLGFHGSNAGLFADCKLEKVYYGRNLSYGTSSSSGYSPFYNIKTLKEVVFGDSVTSIGVQAFGHCSSLGSISLPENVTSIGTHAFMYCSSLSSVKILSKLTLIDQYAFAYCSSLTSLTLPETITGIKSLAFRGCTGLAVVTLPKGLTEIESNAFESCNSLRKIINYSDLQLSKGSSNHGYVAYWAQQIINVDAIVDDYYYFDTDANGKHHLTYYEGTDSILTLPSDYQGGSYGIDDAVFSGHSEIVSIQLPDEVESIGANTFNGCSSLNSLTIPDSVSSIGASAFSGCSSLASLTLPESVTSIGTQAFYNCSSLASVNVPEGVSVIEEYTFGNCASLDSLTIPASVTSIGNYAFQGCTALKELTLADGGKTLSLGINGYYENGGLFTSCKLKKLYLGRNLSYNTDYYYGGYSPFYNQTALKEVVVGDSVTAIHANAFYNCSSLPSIHLHEGVTSVGANAFSGCGILTYVYSDIESPAVLASSSLRNQAVIYVPEGTYVPYKELFPNNIIVDGAAKEVTVHVAIPGTLGEEVLTQVPYIRNVNSLKVSGTLNSDDISTITGSMVNLIHLDLSKTNLTSANGIGHANLCSIVFPDSCKSISGYNERDNLTSVTLPDAVETLGNNCFEYCYQLAEVTVSTNLKTIGSYAFRSCGKLKEVTFKDGDKSIGNHAFYDCDNLTSVSFGAGVASIGESAFRDCANLTSLSFGAGVASIGRYTFANCGNLTTLVLGDRISVNNLYSFQGCGNLSEIHIPSIEAWLNSTFYDYYESCPNRVSSKTNLYIDGELVTDVVIPSSVTYIRPFAFSQMSGITSVTIPEGVTSLANNAFFNCSGLTEVTMSKGLKTISSEAFYGCNRLASVIIPDGVTTIDARAFAQCDSLRSITLPSTLSNCAAGAFSGSGLTEVTCPAFFPPVTGGDLIGANNCTLYVPEWTLNRYKLANNWNLFAAIEPISGIYPSTISVYTEEALAIPAEGLAEGYIPNLELVRYDASNVGRLTLRGEKAMPLSTFRMEQTRDAGTMTSLVNYGTLTADSVATELTISANTWHYLSFPYDVKIADIATLGDWVIRRYDGASRARADFSSTWQNVPYDSILHAGEGYIWYSTNGNFTVPAIENDNRNLIFANDTRYTQLKEHASATVANYGWNLIGNPYPCFYDTRFMEFSSPITVRSGNSYAAYSPLDDSYILSPLEAFFVQCSADNNVVGFTAEGRQTDNTVRALTSAPQRARAANSERKVFNLYLESDSYADHTRFVINEKARLDYEISCDAAKFMSDDPAVQQLFTIEGGEHMAINERPLANGEVMLGAYFGKGGSYTIALDTRATEMEVVLIDRYTGAETDLLTGSYMFTTEAGMFTDRFAIGMKRTGDVTAIETPAAKLEVVAVEGAISIRNAAAPVHIYNAAGALVTTEHGQEVTVEAAPGIYVVKVGNAAHKVSVIK